MRILVRTLETMAGGVMASLVIVAASAAAILATGRRVQPPITAVIPVVVYVILIRRRIDVAFVVGLVLLAVPLFVDVGNSLLARAAIGVPGAAVIGFGTTPGPVLLDLAVTGAIAVGGALAADTADAHDRIGLGTLFLILATIGGWLDIPDVDRVLILLGASLPVAALVWPIPLARVGAGAYLWVGALLWTAVEGGAIRLSSVVGTTAALGMLLIEPLVRRSLGWQDGVFLRMWGDRPPLAAIAPSAVQAAVVLLASRVAGLQRSTEASLIMAAAILAAAFAGLRAAAPRLARGGLRLE